MKPLPWLQSGRKPKLQRSGEWDVPYKTSKTKHIALPVKKQLQYFSPTASANGVFSPDKLRCVPVRVAGAGSGQRFRKVPESSGVCWCRFRKQVPEGPGTFRRDSGVCWCGFRRQDSEGSREFRRGLLPCDLDRSSHVIVLNIFWWWHCPHGQNHCAQTWHICRLLLLGDIAEAYYIWACVFLNIFFSCRGDKYERNLLPKRLSILM